MFTWKPIYAEIAAKLPGFASENGELAQLMVRLHEQGLKVSSVADRDVNGADIPLDEIDPFSFLANFNRGITNDNRKAILAAIKDEWGLTSDLPSDFDGLPLMSLQNSWFIPWKAERRADHVPTLWRFYEHVLHIESPEDLDVKQFDACCGLKGVAPASLSMGMFSARPDVWIAVDKKNRAIAATKGIDFKTKTGADYLRWLGLVKNAFPMPTVEFSHQAHLNFVAVDPDEDDEDENGEEGGGEPASGERNYWLLAPGQGAGLWDVWYERSIGGLGWNEMGDLDEYESKQAIVEYMPELSPNSGPVHVARMLWDFAHEMKPGDIVFAKLGLHKVCGWGIVAGDYTYDENEEPFHNLRRIDWRDATEFSMPTGNILPLRTLTRMTGKRKFLDPMADAYDGVPGLQAAGGTGGGGIKKGGGRLAGTPYELSDAMDDLFMAVEEVQQCVELLRHKKNLVLQGTPGTGKTFVAKRLAYLLMQRKDNSRVQMVQFHQSMTYEDFVQGYKPAAEGGFKLEDGTFHKFVSAAMAKPDVPFVFIIDEINRGNLSKVFGELMMLIEPDKRTSDFAIPLSYSSDPEATFYVPPNMHLIGTMNTADRSLSMVDYALRRRFSFVDLEPGFQSPVFAKHLMDAGASEELVAEIRQRMKMLNQAIKDDESNLGKGYQIGHSFFVPPDGQTADDQWMKRVLTFEIKPLIEEYYCDDPAGRQTAIETIFG